MVFCLSSFNKRSRWLHLLPGSLPATSRCQSSSWRGSSGPAEVSAAPCRWPCRAPPQSQVQASWQIWSRPRSEHNHDRIIACKNWIPKARASSYKDKFLRKITRIITLCWLWQFRFVGTFWTANQSSPKPAHVIFTREIWFIGFVSGF